MSEMFSLQGQVAVVTGGSGVLGSALAQGLAQAGARVAILGRRLGACQQVAASINAAGGEAIAIAADVLDRAALETAATEIAGRLGPVDLLVNGAGGNDPRATVSADHPFFDLDAAGVNAVLGSNFTGTLTACQVWGRVMAERGQGTIITIASMAALRPLTRVGVYGAAKAAVVNFTQWLAVHMAQEYSPAIRVNAIAPGFFLTEQNRFLLTDAASGELTARGQSIIAHTPQRRFGAPEDLVGTLVWLASPAAAFVTGIVVPVDGGFAAFGGV
ncbi:MAG: SDR family oxidoreductase [Ktedonobacterales bacterium]|nr:SDR family oxidoreductase [Ktedonobacterales bacterium]